MEVGDKLKELNMTVDEVNRLTKAFKDEKFKEMLRDYAEEISDPENKRRYEEEIKLLEQERGNTIEFIHPQPFRALKTSVDGKQKCFINICANEKVGKPVSSWGVSEDGRRGQRWSLPHSLHPGRQDTDPRGNKIIIYDVIFHPDTLHIASKNKKFMDMVDSTAIQGIQDAFRVTLDQKNVRQLSTKYKGTPQPCVIRKPIPGFKAKEASKKPDPLAFPYPDDKSPTTPLQARPTASPVTKGSTESQSFHIHPQTSEPTKPHYTVKYRSFIDLQDFRCSRDSAQSPRPKEIVVIIDMPLLKAVADTSLEVKERRLLLESKNPAYRLELPLAYPVDEDKGEAKFSKQRGQLTVTLPVLPSSEAFDFNLEPALTSVSDDERQEERSEVQEEDTRKEEGASLRNEAEEQKDVGKEDNVYKETESKEDSLKQQESEEKGVQEKGEEQMRGGVNGEGVEIGVEEEAKCEKQKRKGKDIMELGKLREQMQENTRDDNQLNLHEDKLKENLCMAADGTEKLSGLITDKHSSCTAKEGEVNRSSCLVSELKITSNIREDTEKTKQTLDGNQVKTDTAFLQQTSSEAVSSITAESQSQNNINNSCVSQATEEEESSKMMHATDEMKSSGGASGNKDTPCTEEPATSSMRQQVMENIDQDDLLTEQIFHNQEYDNKPPPVLLREIDENGNEKIISDHSTSAGFIFQNTLMFELD